MAFLNQLPDEQEFFLKKALLNDHFSYFREYTNEDLLCAFRTNENWLWTRWGGKKPKQNKQAAYFQYLLNLT